MNGKEFSPTQDIGEGVKDWINVGVTKENSNEEIDLITCTFEHPFYVLNADTNRAKVLFEGKDESRTAGSWIASKDLRIGDQLLLSSGENAIISSLEVEHYDEPQITYNFEVADYHTYYVGEKGILVHNDCPKYRGYNNGQSQKTYASNRHVDKIDDLVQSTRGASVNTNPLHETMNVFDHVDEIVSMSDDLMYVPKPSPGNPGHFEIVPKTPMSMSKFNKLLGQIQYRPFR